MKKIIISALFFIFIGRVSFAQVWQRVTLAKGGRDKIYLQENAYIC